MLERWGEGPLHQGVRPVVITFREKADRNALYQACREGLKKVNLVITEDSRSVSLALKTLDCLKSYEILYHSLPIF